MLAAAGVCAAVLCASAVVYAAPVKGTVSLPAAMKSARRHVGYWRLENGNVPIAPAAYRGDTVVVLEGLKGPAPSPKTVTVEISGMQVSTPVVVLGPGSVVEIKNNDKVSHDLGIPDSPKVMPVERLAAGNVRRTRFSEPGGYFVRCGEYPHIAVSVIIVSSPSFAVVEEKGGFKIPEAAEGKGTLRVWSHGRWVHSEPIEVTARPADLQVKVTSSRETREAVE